MIDTNENALEIKNLKVCYYVEAGAINAVDQVNLDLPRGKKMGLVGESGSGKSTLALAVLQMIRPPGKIEAGHALLDGVDLLALPEDKIREYRLQSISMIPQGAMNSLHPLERVKDQIIEGFRDHGISLGKEEAMDRVYELLESVELDRGVANMYPHELSGGMKQRVCVAIAISMHPQVILADEPTSALDVVIQRQVMETINRLQEELNLSLILIGHDMGLMAQTVDRLAVMYAGRLVEVGDLREIFDEPLHPYTQALIQSLPSLERKGVFEGIPGIPPSLVDLPPGCVFNPRCNQAMSICKDVPPDYRVVGPGRWVACHLYDGS